jgi:hypothetical protein
VLLEVTDDSSHTFKVNMNLALTVTDLRTLEAWVGKHVESLPDISYSEEWVDPTDPENDNPMAAYISDAAAYLPTDPESMLMLATQCLVVLLPGIEVEESNWSVE